MLHNIFYMSSIIFKIVYNIYEKVTKVLNLTYQPFKLNKTTIKNQNIYNEFNVLINDKYYKLILLNTCKISYDTIITNSEKYTNFILNCTFISKEKSLDITKEFKKFSLYFSSHNYPHITWNHVLKYILNSVEITDDDYIEITLNDDDMSIYHNKIKPLLPIYFSLNNLDTCKVLY
jgi:hypothetical protein